MASVNVVPKLVALALSNGEQFTAELQSAWEAGDAVLPVDRRLPPAMQHQLVTEMGASVLVEADEIGRRNETGGIGRAGGTTSYRLAGGRPMEEGDALVMATSGSSGQPKGAILTHEAIAASAQATNNFLGAGGLKFLGVDGLGGEVGKGSHRWLACLPLSHVGGLAVVVRALLAGIKLEIHDGFDAAAVTKAAIKARAEGDAVLTALVPTALARIDPSLFSAILLGGSAVPQLRPPNVIATYGMTETFSGVVYDGWPLAGVGMRVVDGEVQLRGPMLLRCYRDGTNPVDSDGWLSTGDAGVITPEGKLSVFGRKGEMIITGGENVWPVAVERALVGAPGVGECAVVGRDDDEWGEVVTAVVIPTDATKPPQLEALREYVKQALPAYCAPRRLEIVSAFARTALGKIRRHLL